MNDKLLLRFNISCGMYVSDSSEYLSLKLSLIMGLILLINQVKN